MTIASSGAVSLSQLNTEIGVSATNPIDMNDASVRFIAQKPSGIVTLNDCRGKKYANMTSGIDTGTLSCVGFADDVGGFHLTCGSISNSRDLNGYTLIGIYLLKGFSLEGTPPYSFQLVVAETDAPSTIWNSVIIKSSTGTKTYNRSDCVSGAFSAYFLWEIDFGTDPTEWNYWNTHFGSGTQVDVLFTVS